MPRSVFFSLNQDGKILYGNRMACQSLGYTIADLTALTVFDIDPCVSREAWPSIWERLCIEKSATFEGQQRRKDGSVFPIEVAVTLIEFEGRRYSMALTKGIREESVFMSRCRSPSSFLRRLRWGFSSSRMAASSPIPTSIAASISGIPKRNCAACMCSI